MTHKGRAVALMASTLTMGAMSVALMAGPASAAADKDCKDFATQQQAQQYFNANGGSPSNNFNDLDSNHNGVACESLPRGTAQSSGSASSKSSVTTSTHASTSTHATTRSSQVRQVPSGAAATGGGSTVGLQHEGLIVVGGALVAAGALTGGVTLRRRASAGR